MNRKSSIDYSLVPTDELKKALDAAQTRMALSYLLKPTTDELDAQIQLGMYHSTMNLGVATKELFENQDIDELGQSTFHNLVSNWLENHNERETLVLLKRSYPEIEPQKLYELLKRYIDEQDGIVFGPEEELR